MSFPLGFVRGCFSTLSETAELGLDAAWQPEVLNSVSVIDANGGFYDVNDDRLLEETHESLAFFLNANEARAQEEIVFAPSVEILLTRLSRALGEWIPPQSEIILSDLEHDAILAPFAALESGPREHVIKYWGIQKPEGQLNLKMLERQLTDATRVVVASKSSTSMGTVNELLPAALRMRDREGYFVVNWSPFVSHGSLDIRFLRSDFVVASMQSMFGARLAWLWGKQEWMARIRKEIPDLFEGISIPRREVERLKAVLDYIEKLGHASEDLQLPPSEDFGRRRQMRRGMQAIRHYERELSTLLLRRIESTRGVRVYGIQDSIRAAQRTPRVLFSVDGVSPEAVVRQFAAQNIRLTAGSFGCERLMDALKLPGGAVAATLAHYHREEDVEQFADCLREVR